jgi:hypothetical protein
MGRLADKHLKTNALQAAGAFAKHVITKRSEGRWLLQQIHQDGKPDWTMAAEIVCLEGRAIFVGGDIDHTVFSCGPRDPIARVRWMGECGDLGYYVRQKARIGTARHPETVDEWHSAVAEEELKIYLADREEEEPGYAESDDFDLEEFESACGADDRDSFYEHAMAAFKHADFQDFSEMGEVLSPAVIYCHAALARLCVLLREEEAATEAPLQAAL